MRPSFRLGRIAGVEVGVNWSLAIVFLLLFTGLAFGRFPEEHPGQATAAYVVAGLVTASVFFASVLAHEVGHAVVAQRHGVAVDSITLWLFGGVAKLGGEADTPGAELRIAAVGPLISVVAAAAAGLVALVAGGTRTLVGSAALWLAGINLALAVFNMLPGAPLDGGRVLRAVLWKRSGRKLQSAARAARAGRAVGFAIVGIGLFQLFAGLFGGLWLALIGWFLISAASAEEQSAELRRSLGDLRVSEVMSSQPVTAPAELTLDRFLDDYVFRHRFSTFPVERNGRLWGLASVNRIKDVASGDRATTTVGQLARPLEAVATAAPGDRMSDVLASLQRGEDARLLVLEGDQLVGIVSPRDVMRVIELGGLRQST